MIPATIDFLLRTNADYGEELQFVDGDTYIDLTDMTFSMEVRRYPGGPLLFTVPIGALDEENGTVSLGISRDVIATAYLTVTGRTDGEEIQLSHDILVEHVDGFREPWAEGRVTIRAGVTQNG